MVVGEKALPFGKVENSNPSNGGDLPILSLNGGWLAMGPCRPIVCGKTQNTTDGWRTGILRGGQYFRSYTGGNIIFEPRTGQPGFTSDPNNENTYGFGSWHSGVRNFVVGDGSVKSISNAIDTKMLGYLAIVDDGKSVTF